MLKKGDVFKVSDLTYGVSKTHGAWAMVKTKVEKDPGVKRKSGIVTVWVKNPEEIRNAKEFRVDDILEVQPADRYYQGRLVSTCNVVVVASAVEYREDRYGVRHTPEDDIAEFFGL